MKRRHAIELRKQGGRSVVVLQVSGGQAAAGSVAFSQSPRTRRNVYIHTYNTYRQTERETDSGNNTWLLTLGLLSFPSFMGSSSHAHSEAFNTPHESIDLGSSPLRLIPWRLRRRLYYLRVCRNLL